MRPISDYILESIYGNLNLDKPLVEDDIKRIESLLYNPLKGFKLQGYKYDVDGSDLIVKTPEDRLYVAFEIEKPVSGADADAIKFINKSDKPIINYVYYIDDKIDYPYQVLDKIDFPKDTIFMFLCKNTLRIDDKVFANCKLSGKPSAQFSEIEQNDSALDLSKFTIPLEKLVIDNFKSVEFNANQKVDTLYIKPNSSAPAINTLPDCKNLVLDCKFAGKAVMKNLMSMFNDFTPGNRLPKISIQGKVSPKMKESIINKILGK